MVARRQALTAISPFMGLTGLPDQESESLCGSGRQQANPTRPYAERPRVVLQLCGSCSSMPSKLAAEISIILVPGSPPSFW